MFYSHDIISLGLVLFLFALIFSISEVGNRIFKLPTEITRKFAHFFSGLIIACFPFLFRSFYTLLSFCFICLAIMLFSRKYKLLPGIYALKRHSLGDIYLLISILLLFWLTAKRPIFYSISILNVAVCDALAALPGTFLKSQKKTWLGSVTFFISSFAIALIFFMVGLKLDFFQSSLKGAVLAAVLTVVEAISLKGSDNLTIPLISYLMLIALI